MDDSELWNIRGVNQLLRGITHDRHFHTLSLELGNFMIQDRVPRFDFLRNPEIACRVQKLNFGADARRPLQNQPESSYHRSLSILRLLRLHNLLLELLFRKLMPFNEYSALFQMSKESKSFAGKTQVGKAALGTMAFFLLKCHYISFLWAITQVLPLLLSVSTFQWLCIHSC
ncbi:hypothetical protein CPB83DRAFT_193389 [Crepidotus variabilis]|uniref:Uncharacterized protein n=1 Tax=Crepidotus variabilis TaxID=179855 RepID=A0A9P6EJL4_9AGAR|nr:hypothetical protein CPB83DRAFT_193389 [Crepidotus variabilis]